MPSDLPVSDEPDRDDDVTRWPEHLARRYRERGYWQDETLGAFLRDRAARFADRVAVRDERLSLTYAQLDAAVDRAALRLRGIGIGIGIDRGDRVVVQIDNRVELYVVQFALFRLGAVPVMALPAHGRLELQQFCRIAEPVAIVASSSPQVPFAERAELVAGLEGASLRTRLMIADAPGDDRAPAGVTVWSPVRAPVDHGETGPAHEHASTDRAGDGESAESADEVIDVPHSEDLAFLQLSGGSTGVPKLIPRTHADYLYSVRESARICALTPDDVMLIPIPAAHNYPYSSPGALGVWHAGGTVVLAARPDPDVCLPELVRSAVTIVPLVPPVAHLWRLAQESGGGASVPASYPSLRLLQVGGAKLSQEVARGLERAFATPVQQVFGMAEGLVNYTRLDDDEATRTATQGLRISEADEVRVVDADGTAVADGETGALETQGPYTIRGYYRNDAANREAFTADGWYRTGDLVRVDARGYLTVVGRAKAVINRGGEKVSPEEIEFHLHADPRVLDAVVEPVADAVLGERIRAILVAREPGGLTAGQVRSGLRERGLADYKIPDQVRFVDELDRIGVGKNRRASAGTSRDED